MGQSSECETRLIRLYLWASTGCLCLEPLDGCVFGMMAPRNKSEGDGCGVGRHILPQVVLGCPAKVKPGDVLANRRGSL